MWRNAIGVLALAIALGACGSSTRAQGAATDGDITIAVVADPGVVGERNELRVRLEDAQHHPVTGAHVTVQIEMPAMPMHRAPLPLEERNSGEYATARPDFDMDGEWTTQVTATGGAGRRIEGVTHLRIRD
ncbi:hypothetical protein EPN44_06965 [bacterium]|nr:MAG: hypothetical protein EPN44_06965 [bacterium]